MTQLEQGPNTFAERAFRFYKSLKPPPVPSGVEVMNPYTSAPVEQCVRAFFDKYFSDNYKRTLILGINPGRFGAGLTGVMFTDPVALADNCRIPNNLGSRRETSAQFVYSVVEHMGGPKRFFRRFVLSAICPLGFTRGGRNLNYYDDRELEIAVTPFIISSVEAQIALGCNDCVVVLGSRENARFLNRLNERHHWFKSIQSLDHPRYIQQYRRAQVNSYIRKYERTLLAAYKRSASLPRSHASGIVPALQRG